MSQDAIRNASQSARAGGKPKYHESNAAKGKLFARERIARLCDEGSFVEDGLLANNQAQGLSADGVVTGVGRVAGRPVAVMANDSTVSRLLGRARSRRSSGFKRKPDSSGSRWSIWSTRPAHA